MYKGNNCSVLEKQDIGESFGCRKVVIQLSFGCQPAVFEVFSCAFPILNLFFKKT